ncbi:hypothetical protein [Chryseobacterium indoltheticum]|uniref:Holin n=1 Tax=Chryseobacterium indoltheticum TaxID=254 RepID=A0A381FAS9_9FLAO|nr:hypothetical protein [Chryseobacterium indoltheticum]AZA73582.1 hypothetical protein EG358_07350 [Chryseobacterium indoltheticum]SIR23753.1 hypothetical protein SAMN05421682_11571 [Chryseobacterium indoltheticum]SUX43553.1 Uncharacterised protein [Chryseobacterium indoltheticum]
MIKQFIINNLLAIHSSGVGGKMWSSLQLALVPAVGLTISERITGWYLESYVFIFILGFAIIADLVAGVWKHMKFNTFSPKKMMIGFSQKIGLVILVYFLTEAFIQIIADAELDSIYFKVASKIMIFIYPAGNALVNIGIITDGKFPPLAFLRKFEKFNKTLNINDLNLKNNETDIDSNSAD